MKIGIVIDNVYFTDMQNYRVTSRDDFSNGASGARAAVMVKGLPARSRYAVNELTIKNCEVYNCGNGFIIWGSWNDKQEWWCENEEDIDPVFNEGLLIEGCYLHEMDAEAVLVGMCDGALVTNCRAINSCQGPGTDENGVTIDRMETETTTTVTNPDGSTGEDGYFTPGSQTGEPCSRLP